MEAALPLLGVPHTGIAQSRYAVFRIFHPRFCTPLSRIGMAPMKTQRCPAGGRVLRLFGATRIKAVDIVVYREIAS